MLTGVLTIAAPVAVAQLVLAFVVARRALRLFVKLAIVSVLALVLLCGYVWWRWQGSTASAPTHNRQTAPARR
jgi:membrane protein implicated in regulation of membrane protease activity